MRISDCAELTGTTVRTIRYYHQIGLLPVPVGRGVRRDYGLDHIARILRIRWLADAGLSLDAVADLLAAEERSELDTDVPEPHAYAASLRDLRATGRSIDERMAQLQSQRRRISALIAMAEEGRELTALPAALETFYDRIAAAATDPGARKVLQRERRLAEMFAQRGLMPKRVTHLIDALTPEDLAMVVDFYTRYARLAELPADAVSAEIDDLVATMVRWSADNREITAGMLDILPAWARRPRSMAALVNFSVLVCSDGRQEEVIRRSVTDVIALIDGPAPAATGASAPTPSTSTPQAAPAPSAPSKGRDS
ncbi:MAG: MerR family transcriptional regulator [Propionibacteriaceae bacterium]|nr:MerR family transcriptional regulator [Propionibacteriaceae bacterium]